MAKPLSVGCLFSDRIEALLDGRVTLDGRAFDLRIVEAQALFRSVLRDAAWDVAELSMASHIAAVAAGRRDYVGVPVFPSRSFRHANLYVRTDRIRRPEDLAGARIGVIDWQQTAALWVRGILADEHGVDRRAVDWVAAGLHAPVPNDRVAGGPPPGIRLRRSADTLDAMVRAGAIDAVISPTAPRAFADPDVPVDRMWPDAVAAETAYWHRTGIFPIMHVLVVRRSLAATDPGLAPALETAFSEALRVAAADLAARDFPKLALPWLPAAAATARRALGGDPWTYGIEANFPVLETMLRYAVEDGLASRDLQVNELFD